jgi:serine/threonine protein phosphatase 1
MKEKRYYCFPDIHGCSDALKKALTFVYKENPEGGKIIFLGDYIDRGPDNYGVLQIVMNPPKGWEFITLLGNHEAMFLQSYFTRQRFYDFDAAKDIAGFHKNTDVRYDHISAVFDTNGVVDWMRGLKVFHIEDVNVFAHAFYDDTLDPEDQRTNDVIWTRMSDYETFQNSKQGLFLTHGHTPRKNGPIKSPNRINLDCGAVFYGRYVIGEYRKDVQGPIAFHEFIFDGHLNW